MHCADTVVNVLNDEENWQYSMSGLDKARNAWSPRKYWIRWRSVLLFVAKSSVQWIFGIAVFVDVWFWVSIIDALASKIPPSQHIPENRKGLRVRSAT